MFKKEPVAASVDLHPKRGRFVFFDNTLYPIQNGQVIINGVAYPVMVKKMTELPEWVWSWVVPNFGMKMKTFNYADTWSVYFLGDKYMIFQDDGKMDYWLSEFGNNAPNVLACTGEAHYQFEGFDKRLMQRKNPLDPFYRDKYWDTPYYKDDEKCIKENKKRLEKAKREKRPFTDKVVSKYDGFVKYQKNITLGAEVFGKQRLYATDGPDSTAVRFSKEEWTELKQKIYTASVSKMEPSAVIKYFGVGVQDGDNISNFNSEPIPMCADMLDMGLIASVTNIMEKRTFEPSYDKYENLEPSYEKYGNSEIAMFEKNTPGDADKIQNIKKEYMKNKLVGSAMMDYMWGFTCEKNHVESLGRKDYVIYYYDAKSPLEENIQATEADFHSKVETKVYKIAPLRSIMLHDGTIADPVKRHKTQGKMYDKNKIALGSSGMQVENLDEVLDIVENTLALQEKIGNFREPTLSFETLIALYNIIKPVRDNLSILEMTLCDDSEFYKRICMGASYLKAVCQGFEQELHRRIESRQFSLTVEEAKRLSGSAGKCSARKILRVPEPDKMSDFHGNDFAPGYERDYKFPTWKFRDWDPDVQWTQELKDGTVEVHTGRMVDVREDENGNYIRATLRAVPEHMGGAPTRYEQLKRSGYDPLDPKMADEDLFDSGAYDKGVYCAGDTGAIDVSPPGIIFDVPADCAAIMSAETYEKVKAYIRGDEELIKTIKRREAVRVNAIYGIPPIPVVKTSGDSDSVQEYEDDYEG